MMLDHHLVHWRSRCNNRQQHGEQADDGYPVFSERRNTHLAYIAKRHIEEFKPSPSGKVNMLGEIAHFSPRI